MINLALVAIGMKGGCKLSLALFDEVIYPAIAAVQLCCVIPLWTYEEKCLEIIQHLKGKYLEKYAMITSFHLVTVLRMQHFY
ncbi:MAG: hypothetical protein ACKO1F_14070 [Flammeovirgaceae bacterium]